MSIGALALRPPHVVVGPPVRARPAVMLRLAPPRFVRQLMPPLLSRHSLVVSPTLASCRTTPSATISRAPPPPPVFVMPVGPAPPLYMSRSGSLLHAPPHMLLQLFSVDDASSTLRVAIPVSWRNGPSACSSSCVAVGSPFPLLVAPLSCHLLPPIASLRPSPWAGCRPCLLLGRSAGCHTQLFSRAGWPLPRDKRSGRVPGNSP